MIQPIVSTALGQINERTNSVRSHVVQAKDALGNGTYYRYDAFGNLIQTTDSQGNIITTSYDARGNKIGMNDPDMGQWSYAYNALGQLTSQTDAKGQISSLEYDLLGRLLKRTELKGTQLKGTLPFNCVLNYHLAHAETSQSCFSQYSSPYYTTR